MADINADPGDTIEVDYSVENTGELDGTQDIVLTRENGDKTTVDQAEGISLQPDDTDSGTLVWEDVPEGSYTLCVESDDTSSCLDISALDIPDTVAKRPDDDKTATDSSRRGLEFSPQSDFGSMGFKISGDTSGLTTAYVYDLSDDDAVVIATKDISNLSALDTFTVDADYVEGQSYGILGDADGSDYTVGSYSGSNDFPYESTDVDITGALVGDPPSSASNSQVFVEVGDLGFD